MSSFGRIYRVTTFGESHCDSVGVIIDGCPSNMDLNEDDIQPQLTRDFLVSSNHFYVFFILSVLGFLSFSKNLKKISYYLILLSILLELLHIIIPNRGFEVADLLGNILGVLLSLILFKFFIFRRLK